MNFQSVMSAALAETAFRSVVSGVTATNTDAALQEGEPVIISTATIGLGPLGQEVVRGVTATSLTVNRLVVGAVKGTIAHEAVGLVQVYGVGPVRLAEAATVAAGDKLIPDL